MTTLSDLGERAIVAELLAPRYSGNVRNFGDDVAIVGAISGVGSMVASTDPCPEHAAKLINLDSPQAFGHLLAAINLSDIAASGANPVGVLVSLELPGQTTVEDFISILDGIDGCCDAVGAAIIGGNLRESSRIGGTGFALGQCSNPPMSRTGARDGDLIAIVGTLGLAWTRILAETHGVTLTPADKATCEDALLRPRPLVAVGKRLASRGVANACTDASDGVMAAIATIARASHVGVELNLDALTVAPVVERIALSLGVHPWQIARGWGDWQLVCAVSPDRRQDLEHAAAAEHVGVAYLGQFAEGNSLIGELNGQRAPVAVLDSERFRKASRSFLEWYRSALLDTPVFDPVPVLHRRSRT